MKRFYFAAVAAIAAVMFSCDTKEAAPEAMPEDGIVTLEREFEIPGMTRSGNNGFGGISATFDLDAELVLSYEIHPEALEYLGLTAAEFDRLLRDELGDEYDNLLPQLLPEGWTIADCVNKCNSMYTDAEGNKLPGRGRCLAGCWFDGVFNFIIELARELKDALTIKI